MESQSLSDLYRQLQGDRRRIDHPFSQEILEANALLHNLSAFDDEICECLWKWCKNYQPCQFGGVAASEHRIHFHILRESALTTWRDTEIAEYVAEGKRLWKQRAAYDPKSAAHSFVLVVAAPQVALAAPDVHLRAFADRVLQLTGWTQGGADCRRKNTISSDYLYLRNPSDGKFYGFQFNLDFFACAGDKRWWHDHRFPGGIAFTANSTGHMRWFREWYMAKGDMREWAVKQAMLTISNATPGLHNVAGPSEGRVTWLRSLDSDGLPYLRDVPCPLSKVPKQLEGKDWTGYEGFLHTDHAVREELFQDRETPPTRLQPYLLDFTYLYDEGQPDFRDQTAGKEVAEEEIFAEIGDRATWSHRHVGAHASRSEDEEALVAEQLAACDRWRPPAWYAPID